MEEYERRNDVKDLKSGDTRSPTNTKCALKRPIVSYGIILYTIKNGDAYYQLGQRRDTYGAIEFIKGNLKDDEIPNYINLMSSDERERILGNIDNFEKLWDDLWINHQSKGYKTDSTRAYETFQKNMKKYLQNFMDTQKCADDIKKNAKTRFNNDENFKVCLENPWIFSKGRKHTNETSLHCAIREFEEETGISRNLIHINNHEPFEEMYIGTDGKLYKTIYYLAFIPKIPFIFRKYPMGEIYIRDSYISDEISDVEFFSYIEAMEKLNDVHKKKILQDVNNYLLFISRNKRRSKSYPFSKNES